MPTNELIGPAHRKCPLYD